MPLPALEKKNKRPFGKGSMFTSLTALKTVVMMKLTLIIMFAFCFDISAKGFAKQISLSEKNAPLEKIFLEIKKQSGYQFLYKDEMLQN